MRNIKFRAWHKENKEMCYLEEYEDYHIYANWFANASILQTPVGNDDDLSSFILMQSTGLKDENGEEVFEGDIVKGKNLENFDEIAEVKWDYVQWHPFAGHRGLVRCEVIGNIYENPDLLINQSK